MKKSIITALLMAAAMGTVLTGCGGDKSTSGGEAPKISIMMADAGRAHKADHPIIAEINKRLGIEIDLQLIPTAEFKNKFNVSAAGGTLPDMVRFGSYDYFQYVSQNLFMDISDKIGNYENISAIGQEVWDLSRYDENCYAIPIENTTRGKNNTIVRKDWLDKLGMPMPENLDELREMYKAFTYNDPDGNGVNDTYGLSTTGEIVSGWPESFMPIFGACGVQPGYYSLEGNEVICGTITQNYKNALEYLYQLYSVDKVIDPDMFIVKTDQARQNFVRGRFGSFTGMWSIGPQVCVQQMNMPEVSPGSEIAVLPAIKGPDGKSGYRSKSGLYSSISLSNETKNPDKCLELVDFLLSDEGTILSLYGFENEYYTVEEVEFEGEMKKNYVRTQVGQDAMDNKWLDSMAMFCAGSPDDMVNAYYNDELLYSHTKAAADTPLYYDLFEGLTTETVVSYSDSLGKFELESMINFITGKRPISEFDSYVSEWKKKGGEEVFRSLVDEYNKRHGTNYTAKLD